MQAVTPSELSKVTYLDPTVLGDRVVLLLPMWDGKVWRQWYGADERTLLEFQPVDTVCSKYLASAPAKEGDLFFWFFDFMCQRAYWAETSRFIHAIFDDFHKLGTSAAKLRHFFESRDRIDHTLLSSFVQSELEYILTVCRSVFDLLQEAVAEIWNKRVTLTDAAAQAKRRKLPSTFSKVVLEDNKVRAAEQIAQRFGLPEPLASRYAADAATFAHLRTWRDRIVHGGSSVDIIFVTEKGFGVSPTHPAFADFPWTDDHRYNVAIVSLLPWVANVVGRTFDTCAGLMATLASVVAFPDEVAPGYRVFVRDPVNRELSLLQLVIQGELVWWADQPGPPSPQA